jgi:hypothetical protein
VHARSEQGDTVWGPVRVKLQLCNLHLSDLALVRLRPDAFAQSKGMCNWGTGREGGRRGQPFTTSNVAASVQFGRDQPGDGRDAARCAPSARTSSSAPTAGDAGHGSESALPRTASLSASRKPTKSRAACDVRNLRAGRTAPRCGPAPRRERGLRLSQQCETELTRTWSPTGAHSQPGRALKTKATPPASRPMDTDGQGSAPLEGLQARELPQLDCQARSGGLEAGAARSGTA